MDAFKYTVNRIVRQSRKGFTKGNTAEAGQHHITGGGRFLRMYTRVATSGIFKCQAGVAHEGLLHQLCIARATHKNCHILATLN